MSSWFSIIKHTERSIDMGTICAKIGFMLWSINIGIKNSNLGATPASVETFPVTIL
jgi:uncharacterized membrane protein YwaF